MPEQKPQPLSLLRATIVGAALVGLVLAAFFSFGVEATDHVYLALFVAGLVGDSIVQQRARDKRHAADRARPVDGSV